MDLKHLRRTVGVCLTAVFCLIPGLDARSDAMMRPGTSNTLKAIIGEAADQPFKGQIAVACAIKNRPEGLTGVIGARLQRDVSWIEIEQGLRAISAAKDPHLCYDLIKGADMWENVELFGHPPWDNVIFIIKIGDHSFYRRIIAK